MEDKAGTLIFDNHGESDIPVTGWESAIDRDNVIFRTYVAADYPAQDSVYWALRIYDTMAELAPHAAAVVIACAAAELLLFIFLARAAGRRPGREEAVAGWQEKNPFDLYAAVVLGGSAMLVAAAASGTEDTFQGFEPIMIAVVLACFRCSCGGCRRAAKPSPRATSPRRSIPRICTSISSATAKTSMPSAAA